MNLIKRILAFFRRIQQMLKLAFNNMVREYIDGEITLEDIPEDLREIVVYCANEISAQVD